MSPNKSKRGADDKLDSPEERKSKKRKLADDNEEEEEKEGTSTSSKMKIPAHLSSSSQKPAELFRKDLISAMKLPDSESLAPEDYLLIADSWRQEWERGVQVPVNEVGIPDVDLRELREADKSTGDFKIPKKLLHSNKDETYRQGCHELTGMSQLAEQVVRYDLDDLDVCWLQRVNEEREEIGETMIHEWTVERVIETLETKCHENMEIKKKTEEGLGIEYDEDIVCEICRSPDSEDSNEMVFCDGCDICVHQACYGIATVPEGSWLCRTCALGVKPSCILCPKAGGAMKSTRSGTKWAHVSCAIWIPEVTIGCVEKMEPITKISEIPASRWSLVCTICKERNGACIQCSVKACKTAFHVTCGFSANLEMKTILVEEADDDEAVKLKAYCPKHSKKRERNTSESEPDSPRKSVCGTPKKEMTEEEKATLRAERLQRLEEEFYTVINVHEIASMLQLEQNVTDLIYVYWKLKRKALFNRPLLTPKTEEADLLEKQQEDSLVARMKMFVHLRQDLERVRNLSYMISRREKMKRSFSKSRENVFYAALALLTDETVKLTEKDVQDVVKQYKYISPQSDKKPGKIKVKSKLTDIESESDSGFIHSGFKRLTSKNRKTLTYESDSDAVSVSSAMSSISPESLGGKRGKRTKKFGRKSETEDPKLKIVKDIKPDTDAKGEIESTKPHTKVKGKLSGRKAASNLKGEVVRIKTSSPVKIEVCAVESKDEKMETDVTESDLNISADLDTSEMIDVVKDDDTLVVKSELDTSKDDTLVKSELDTSVCSISENKIAEEKPVGKAEEKLAEKETVAKHITTPSRVKRKAGRPPKKPKVTEILNDDKKVDTDKVKDESKVKETGSTKEIDGTELQNSISIRTRSTRNEKSATDEMLPNEIAAANKKLPNEEAARTEMVQNEKLANEIVVSDEKLPSVAITSEKVVKHKRMSLSKLKSSQKPVVLDNVAEVETESKTDKVLEPTVKTSDGRSLFDTIEKDLIDSLPSSKNIPKDVKAELCGYFRNNKLIVSEAIKQKVQSSLLKCRRNRLFANGIHISSQKSLDTFFNASDGSCETSNESDKTVSRVLNELSPTRDGLESNLQLSKKLLDCDRISDRVRTRSSRDTSPDSHHGSDISSSSLHRSDRAVKRSNSRTSVGKDFESDLTDVENICDSGVKRKTRSMGVDEKKLKERSQSPATLLQKNTPKIMS